MIGLLSCIVAEAPPDHDGDGFTNGQGDCDDQDATVFPGADDPCDGIDQDCSGDETDAPPDVTWYADADADGHGDPETSKAACERPEGYVQLGDDCDDADAAVNPAQAAEICDNGADDDCDGEWSECRHVSLAAADFGLELRGMTPAGPTALDIDGDGVPELLSIVAGEARLDAMHLDTAAGVSSARQDLLFGGHPTGVFEEVAAVDTLTFAAAHDAGDVVVSFGAVAAGSIADRPDADVLEIEGGGVPMAGALDLDGDGTVEIAVMTEDGGAIFDNALRGRASLGDADAEFGGSVVAAAGDLDGDGLGELLSGLPEDGEIRRIARLRDEGPVLAGGGAGVSLSVADGDVLVGGAAAYWFVEGPVDPAATRWLEDADAWMDAGWGDGTSAPSWSRLGGDADGDGHAELSTLDYDDPDCGADAGPFGTVALAYGTNSVPSGFSASANGACVNNDGDYGRTWLYGTPRLADLDADGRDEFVYQAWGQGAAELPYERVAWVFRGRGR